VLNFSVGRLSVVTEQTRWPTMRKGLEIVRPRREVPRIAQLGRCLGVFPCICVMLYLMWHGENHVASLAWLKNNPPLGRVVVPLLLVDVMVEVPLRR
jgi:hypothetical protein